MYTRRGRSSGIGDADDRSIEGVKEDKDTNKTDTGRELPRRGVIAVRPP